MKHIKFLLFVFCLLICSVQAFADIIALPIQDKNGKWGLSDADGHYLVKPQFTEIEDLGSGTFVVAVGGKIKDGMLEGEKWGVIDSKGDFLLKAEYDEIGDFINGLASIEKGGKIGFVNSKWEIIAEPKYDYAGTPNAQGYVWVNSGGKPDKQHIETISGGKYGIIDISGNIIVPVAFSSIGIIPESKYYYGQSQIRSAKSDLERIMLECGSHIALWPKGIDCKSGSILPEAKGFAMSKKIGLRFNGIIDLKGNVLVKEGIYQKCAMPSEGLALVTTKENKCGFHDVKADKFISDLSIRSAFSFEDKVGIGIDSKNKWSFIDSNCSPIGEKFDWISPRLDDYYIVRKGNRMSIINATSLQPIGVEEELIFPLSNGLMAYKDDDTGLWGYLNAEGNPIGEPKYDYAYSFIYGSGFVKCKTGWGMINSDLETLIAPNWDNFVFPSADGFDKVWVSDGSDHRPYQCIDTSTGEQLFNSSFTDVRNFENIQNGEYAVVAIGDKYGEIDSSGNIVVPVEFESQSIAEKALAYKFRHGISAWQPIHSYRFNLIANNTGQNFNIKQTLPSDQWDY